jgi:hypothetical protein
MRAVLLIGKRRMDMDYLADGNASHDYTEEYCEHGAASYAALGAIISDIVCDKYSSVPIKMRK